MILGTRSRASAVHAAVALTALLANLSICHAQTIDHDLSNLGRAVAVDQAPPDYPGHAVRKGQEGWVRMHYVVTADGRAIDPIIADSSGGGSFEEEARKVLPGWRFEVMGSDAELPDNVVIVRTEIRRGRDAATSNFIRRYRRIVTHLHHEEYDTARRLVDEAYALGGWNLYESAMLWLMMGRVDGAEANFAGKLENYRRALAIGTRKALGGDDRRELLSRIFELEDKFGLFADALRTYALLEKERDNSAEIAEFGPRAAQIAAAITSDEVIKASATIYNPCDCDKGEPLWHYRPSRRTFSFANLNGNVKRFEARCETTRIRGDVAEGRSWTLASDWGSCRVFVFGDDGATFDFLEHRNASDNESAGQAAVVRNHVLD